MCMGVSLPRYYPVQPCEETATTARLHNKCTQGFLSGVFTPDLFLWPPVANGSLLQIRARLLERRERELKGDIIPEEDEDEDESKANGSKAAMASAASEDDLR